jgi:lycopene beta-cyclase
MDFRTEAGGDFRFVYALPLGPRRLFVEHVSHQPCDHEAALRQYVREVLGAGSFEIVDREGGATPLFADAPERVRGRVGWIGVGAGLAKTSTGYALTRMWRDAEQIASALANGGEPHPASVRSPLYAVADAFFLRHVASQPDELQRLLTDLFSQVDGDAVLAFLDERARPAEEWAIAGALRRWLLTALVGD